ncbi:unnamed protein product [Penicillium salamii]|nr:unnamed protein product [Penicillium salamii]CAG8105925.1 unnamed protein product [Penicillium salamii]CAG8406457.1 unnamed protein product [Penicillium salamii]
MQLFSKSTNAMKTIHFVAFSFFWTITTATTLSDYTWGLWTRGHSKRDAPVPDTSGICFRHTTQYGDTCAKIAEKYSVSVSDIEKWNTGSWGWTDCPNIMPGDFVCVSSGGLPMPKALPDAQCGPQTPGAMRPENYADLASVKPCAVGQCCARWLKCSNSSEACSSQDGCLSGCGAHAIKNVAELIKAEATKAKTSTTSATTSATESPPEPTTATKTSEFKPHGGSTETAHPKLTWKVSLYEADTCDGGNYYNLIGHNDYMTNGMPCLQLNQGWTSTDMTDETKPSCRWWTQGGNKWEKCLNSPLNTPKSWFLERGFCAVFTDDNCQTPGGRLSQRGGCHHTGETAYSPTYFGSMQCFSYGYSHIHDWQGREAPEDE